ncbi:MAG TPA: Gfo/Idh/MocA family oxidoreductase [Thermoanaerobaculia bacterium]|nr:Gfo/Idh/MocA family oxidoreductase [Thermoanaerobaculia bacterium]
MSETRQKPARQPEGKVRYAVCGLGWFAQVAVLPAFANAEESSELVALVSSDEEKLGVLGDRYDVPPEHRGGYERFEELLDRAEVDAVYVVTPNHLHREFTVRAARAGVHVLCEKPMAVTEEECREMIAATDEAGVRLMIAYRLHFEEANLTAAEIARSGRLGEVRFFSSVFSNLVSDEEDIRLNPIELGGGSLYDIGTYCVNAARYVFADEPTEVSAMSVLGGGRFADCDELTAAVMRFPGERLASFTTCFSTRDHDEYRVQGTRGELVVSPAFTFHGDLAWKLTAGDDEEEERTFPKRDQVAPEILHFSECLLTGRRPEPDGNEGLADVKILAALHRSAAEGGRPVRLGDFPPQRRPTLEQEERRPAQEEPKLVHERAPSS